MQTNPIQYWWKWTVNCGVGELIGIGAAAAFAVGIHQFLGEPQTLSENIIVLSAMVFAGVVEGWILGTMQWKILKIEFPNISYFRWVGVTVVVAMLGWFIGTVSSLYFVGIEEVTVGQEFISPTWLTIGGPIGMGLVLGVIFGYFQWLAFKHYALYTKRWILANALGWAGAMFIIFYYASLPTPTTPTPEVVLMGLKAGLLAGLSVGAITGIALLNILYLNQTS